MTSKPILGYFQLSLAQFSIGANVVICKYLMTFFPAYFILGIRFGVSTLLLSGLLWLKKTPLMDPMHPQGKLSGYDWRLMTYQALSAGVLFNVLFLYGVKFTSATSAGIIGSLLPVFVALCAFFMLKEKITLHTWVAIALASLGICVLSLDNAHGTSSEVGSLLGDSLVLIAMIPEALYTIYNKQLQNRVTPQGGARMVNALSFLMLLPFGLVALTQMESVTMTWAQIGLLGLSGFSSAVFFVCWSMGMKQVPASTASIFGGVMPISTAVLACVFLGERFNLYSGLGMVLVLLSLWVGTFVHTKRSLPMPIRVRR